VIGGTADEVRVGVVNLLVKGGSSLEEHLARIDELAARAVKGRAQFLLLPELTVFDLLPVNPPSSEVAGELAALASLEQEYRTGLGAIARRRGLYLIGASAVARAGGELRNRAYLMTPDGGVRTQDKLYPTPWERKYGFTGGPAVELFLEGGVSLVILVCHDAEFPDISRGLAPLKPEVIFVPSMTDDLHGLERVRVTSAARAVEHMSYVVMTGTAGATGAPWHSYLGQNYLFVPKNKFFPSGESSGASTQETLSVFTLDLRTLRKARQEADQVYPARDLLERESKKSE
jgi:predicted amidohydrolase